MHYKSELTTLWESLSDKKYIVLEFWGLRPMVLVPLANPSHIRAQFPGQGTDIYFDWFPLHLASPITQSPLFHATIYKGTARVTAHVHRSSVLTPPLVKKVLLFL